MNHTKAIAMHDTRAGYTQLIFAQIAQHLEVERLETGGSRHTFLLKANTYCAQWSCPARRSGQLLFGRTMHPHETPDDVARVHGFEPGLHVLGVTRKVGAIDATRSWMERLGAELIQQEGVLVRALPWLLFGIDPVWVRP